MHGDFTRSTFKPENHYSGVRMQQGRVQLDEDFNAQVDIEAHLRETAARDVLGPCGAPRHNAGFAIGVTPDGTDLTISPGRLYVDGILCQVEDASVPITYSSQPDYPSPTPALNGEDSPPEGIYLAYLDVWQRHITALEDPAIREVALGGPDTTTRTKTVWQVKLRRVGAVDDASLNCLSELADWQNDTAPSTGRLRARAEPGEVAADPCDVPARAGYRGLENQLYRVEVHRVLSDTEITMKWSRENGSIVVAWEEQDNLDQKKLTVGSTGKDSVLGFAANDWIELTDDGHELRGEPGRLVKVKAVEGKVLTIDAGAGAVEMADFPLHPKVRRWDMRGEGAITVNLAAADHWIPLEDGVEVRFAPGTYRTGDYWLIPARTATRDIEWPRDESNGEALPQSPHGIQHHYCRLAMLRFDGEIWRPISDCRKLFPPLTELIRFFHVGGGGQEALPGQPLPAPLEVGVANGQWRLEGARVRFQVIGGNGQLRSDRSDSPDSGTDIVEVATDPSGVAACHWQLGSETRPLQLQQVEATLLEIDGKPMVDATGGPLITPLRFNANLSLAREVAYNPERCKNLSGVTTVQEAIDRLCVLERGGCEITVGVGGQFDRLEEAIATLRNAGATTWCLCLLPGEHHWPDRLELNDRGVHVSIGACSPDVRLILDQPLSANELASFKLTGMTVEAGQTPIALRLRSCRIVTIADVIINAAEDQSDAAVVHCLQCGVLTMQSDTITASNRRFLLDCGETERVSIHECHLAGGATVIGGARWITLEHTELTAPSISAPALVLGDSDAHTTLHANLITGLVSLYGWPSREGVDDEIEEINEEILHDLAARIEGEEGEKFNLLYGGGVFQGWGNRLTRFVLGAVVVQNINNPKSSGVRRPIYRSLQLTDNVITEGRNYFLAVRLSLSSTFFHVQDGVSLGVSIGQAATFVGNHGPDNQTQRFVNVCPDHEQAANLMALVHF